MSSTHPSGPLRQRLPGLDGLRAVAAVSVAAYHVWFFGASDGRVTELGWLDKPVESLRAGVALFFVLSGFLLYRPFAAAIIRGRRMPSIRRYFRNRTVRILPAYWVALFVLAAVVERKLLTAPDHLLANMVLVQNSIPSYMPSFNGGVGIYAAWSLAVEAVFYLALPLLAVVANRLRGRVSSRASLAPPILLLLTAGVAAVAERWFDGHARDIWRFAFPPYAAVFALGMLLAVARVLWEDGRLRPPRALTPAAVAVAVIAAFTATKLWYGGGITLGVYYSLMGVAAVAILAMVVIAPTAVAVRILDNRVARSVGIASYSLFLIHGPVIRALRDHGLTLDGGRLGFGYNLVVSTAAVALATFLLYVSVERPLLQRKSRSRVDESAAFVHAAP
jgi:peptidoglycan/LPS O-acetylase OafA/YrhL